MEILKQKLSFIDNESSRLVSKIFTIVSENDIDEDEIRNHPNLIYLYLIL